MVVADETIENGLLALNEGDLTMALMKVASLRKQGQ